MRANPFKPKPIHRAKLMRSDGKVSPLCAVIPRVLDLRVSTWTLRDCDVTCPRCRERIEAIRYGMFVGSSA